MANGRTWTVLGGCKIAFFPCFVTVGNCDDFCWCLFGRGIIVTNENKINVSYAQKQSSNGMINDTADNEEINK